ncbi:response regulator transcription factor [Salinispirillum marinum]|uniref:Response regulator transcription factor n=2 Tax=Saccharospirillaceae TaxID=255527 RepID=A0ABV8BAT4_9GAMM
MSTPHGHVLIVDDDAAFRRLLGRGLTRLGWETSEAENAESALQALARSPTHVLLDLRLGEDNGMVLIEPIRLRHPNIRIILLTGFASIASAVTAIKRGADDYLSKPVDIQAVDAALRGDRAATADTPDEQPPALRRVEWEHIQRVLNDCGGNISEAARVLGMHRRSLQRKLAKKPGPERP